MFALFGAFFLEGSGGAQGSVESQVICFSVGRAGLDIATPFALGVCAAAPAAVAARHPVERVLDFARQEGGTDLYFFAAVPPVGR